MKPSLAAVSVMISVLGVAEVEAGEIIYFLVAEPPGRVTHKDSYVLPLSKQEDIDHARYLISRGELVFFEADRPLVVAKLAGGKDGINRNYVDPTLPEWSWHVVEFLGFGDYTAEILDGSPSGLENAGFGRSGSGELSIGFWNYTVVRELGPHPLHLSIVPEGQRVELYWSSAGTNANYVYTLESSDSTTGTNWIPVPNASWLKTNHWTFPLTSTTTRLYRVRAEQSTSLLSELQFRTLAQRTHSDIQRATYAVIRTQAEWVNLWKMSLVPGPAPSIDFDNEMVVAAALGLRPTGGYAVYITRIEATPNNLRILVLDQTPGPNTIRTQFFTWPFHFVVAPRNELPPEFLIETKPAP